MEELNKDDEKYIRDMKKQKLKIEEIIFEREQLIKAEEKINEKYTKSLNKLDQVLILFQN